MKTLLLSFLFAYAGCIYCQTNAVAGPDLTKYINPMIGTDSKYELSNGNTYPAVSLPWGMNSWSPQTNKMGNGWNYQYPATKIRGFKETHCPSPWIGDYGAFSVFATTEKCVFDENLRESWFSHKSEISNACYYKVFLADYNTTVEITPTERAACFRITYPKTDRAYLIVDAFFKNSFIHVSPKERKITGYSCNTKGGTPGNFKNYFVMVVDRDIEEVVISKDGVLYGDSTEARGSHTGAVIRFKTGKGEKVTLKVASSFISPEQAELNLRREIGNASFDQVYEKARSAWNDLMRRVTVEGGSDNQMSTFYTALYRSMLFPRAFYELDKDNRVIHYSPYNGKVLDGYMFTDNGFWDTFRALFPLTTLVFPEMNSRMMEGLINTYKESGWLQEWASPGHRDCMIGSNSASIIADSYLKGIRGYDINTLYEAILKNTRNEGPLTSVGRYGVNYYNEKGYIPYDVNVSENASRTLEYSYDDFTIWKLSQALKRPRAETDTFYKRANYYKNVFDPKVNFVRGRNKDGSFQSPFRPDKWGDAFTEGCSWHWTWCVFHDPAGLINLMGGRGKFLEKMDSVFSAVPTFDCSYYGGQIHEVTEMLLAGLGQYAHGNEPIQHMPYLYCYAAEPWKTQFHVREIMDKLYLNTPDGLCGDEDTGQTSAWYVFSALGFYPVCPGSGQYVIGSPLFRKATLTFGNGKKLVIQAAANGPQNIYISDMKFNSREYTKNYFNHTDLTAGGVIDMKMSAEPNLQRGTKAEDFPYSMADDGK